MAEQIPPIRENTLNAGVENELTLEHRVHLAAEKIQGIIERDDETDMAELEQLRDSWIRIFIDARTTGDNDAVDLIKDVLFESVLGVDDKEVAEYEQTNFSDQW